ncbi:MAG: hypothetical protein ACTHJJ_08180 [Intrasporangium sp.]|uniref:hypothetical protein n=1 Tax=Intrasporangium sp. TaxID=1925024 RepID=UPI003F821353
MAAMLTGLARWFALGIAWGALARFFMRLVSTTPGFSWEGTLAIVAIGAVTFTLTGFTATAMARGWSGWWRLVAVPALFIFVGQGLAFIPAAVGTFAAMRLRNVWLRTGALVAGLVGNYLLLRSTVDFNWLQPRTLLLGHLLAVVTAAWLGLQFALAARPRAARGSLDAEGASSERASRAARRVTA